MLDALRRRYLDHDALDAAGQSRHQLFAKIDYGLYKVTDGRPRTGRSRRPFILADKLAAKFSKQARSRLHDGSRTSRRRRLPIWSARIRCKSAAATISRCRFSPASTSPTTPAPASCTRRRATAARTSTSGPRTPRTRGARHQHHDPLHGRRRRLLHRPGAGLRPARHRRQAEARHHRQGRQGRRQRGRDQGADRGRHAGRARPAQAPVSAFLALQEAGDLPQHAAMVHRHGQADRRSRTARRSPATRCATARSPRSRKPAGCRRRARTASPA